VLASEALLTWFLIGVGFFLFPSMSFGELASSQVKLPIEVMGADGTTVKVTFPITPRDVTEVRCLWLRVHGLEAADLASVRVNGDSWIPLNNRTVNVEEPGKSYGGIGGGFATLKLTVALPAGTIVGGSNQLEFRFNHTNGVVSGFRVLAFNLLTTENRRVLPAASFVQDDPDKWVPPLPTQEDILAGQRWWGTAALVVRGAEGTNQIRAHCGDCHARDGRDLKYFNYSNYSIVTRSEFHGLSARQSEQIASYIRALPFAHPGRPWNPPYQPGPGMDAKPVEEWAAGAGLDAVLDRDSDSLPYIFLGVKGGMSPTVFAPDGKLNQREIPIAMQLPDWNHWLPQVHPMDAWGDRFTRSDFARSYDRREYAKQTSLSGFRDYFDGWLKARGRVLSSQEISNKEWSPALTQILYAALLWQLVKTWEITQEFQLEEGGPVSGLAGSGNSKAIHLWSNTIPAATAPATVNIPDGPNGMNGSGLTNEYFDNAWYELQILLNDGDHRHHGRRPVDWVYIAGRARDLQQWSGRAEPARLLVMAIKATQSTDPALGPGNLVEGWRPDQTIDPRMMVAPEWSETFAGLPADERLAITQAWLGAWLEKCSRYPTASYFYRGQVQGSYAPPKGLREISGGKVWEAAPLFLAAGVDAGLVRRLKVWGAGYRAAAGLFHY